MVAAELVGAAECLRERDIGGNGRVHFNGRGPRGGEDLCRCYGERKDVGDVGFGRLVAAALEG